MPRKPRFIIPNVQVHIVQRGHSRDPIFLKMRIILLILNG
jgi:putative transposase